MVDGQTDDGRTDTGSGELKNIHVRFENNIPLQCFKINCTFRLYCIAYCRTGITPTCMKLLHIVDMYMCVQVVFGLLDHDDPSRK